MTGSKFNLRIMSCALLGLLGMWVPAMVGQSSIGTGRVKELYQTNCASCHGSQLQGGEGSSLIDDVWKHGSFVSEFCLNYRLDLSLHRVKVVEVAGGEPANA